LNSNTTTIDFSANSITGNLPPTYFPGVCLIQRLNLVGNLITGIVPSQIGNCSNLRYLDLGTNQISGVLPSTVGLLSSLQYMSIRNNGFSGGIPTDFGDLSVLTYLDLARNRLDGPIPTFLGRAIKLTRLFLSNNFLNGTIPTEILQLKLLNTLEAGLNALNGQVPAFGLLPRLTVLSLSKMDLSGTIPSNMGLLVNLATLDLSSNRISGEIPISFRGMRSLSQLDLSSNALSGPISQEFGGISNLLTVDLHNNKFNGTLPTELARWTRIAYLDLSVNQFQGAIPSEFAAFRNILYLSVATNFFNGSIPVQIYENLTNMVSFYSQGTDLRDRIPPEVGNLVFLVNVEWNEFLSGTLPSQIGNLIRLKSLTIPSRQLTGTIPTTIGNLTSLEILDLSSNLGMNGTIPTQVGSLALLRTFNLRGLALTGTVPTQIGLLTGLEDFRVGNSNLKDISWFESNNVPYIGLSGTIPSQFGDLVVLTIFDITTTRISGGCFPPAMNSLPLLFCGLPPDVKFSCNCTVAGSSPCNDTSTYVQCYDPQPFCQLGIDRCQPECSNCTDVGLWYECVGCGLQRNSYAIETHNLSNLCDLYGCKRTGPFGVLVQDPNGDCQQIDNNTRYCSCPVGYQGDTDLTMHEIFPGCEDIDECGLYGCGTGPGTVCINTSSSPNSRTCTCEFDNAQVILIGNETYTYNCVYKLSTADIIGIVVGAVGAFIIALVLILFLIQRKLDEVNLKILPKDVRWQYEKFEKDSSGWTVNYLGTSASASKLLTKGSEEYSRMEKLFHGYLKGEEYNIVEAYAIYNKTLISNFVNSLQILKSRSGSAAFWGQSWKNGDDAGKKGYVHDFYTARANQCPWNPNIQEKIIPVCHGTDFKVAQTICSTGFAALSSLDAGFYGRGIYFTSYALYVLPYITLRVEPAVIISYVSCGNIYPVTENHKKEGTLIGQPIKNGYSSHYVITEHSGHVPEALPSALHEDDLDQLFDEIVIPQESMITPVYLLKIEKKPLFALIKKFERAKGAQSKNRLSQRNTSGVDSQKGGKGSKREKGYRASSGFDSQKGSKYRSSFGADSKKDKGYRGSASLGSKKNKTGKDSKNDPKNKRPLDSQSEDRILIDENPD